MKNEWNWMIDSSKPIVKPIGKPFPPQEVIAHLKLKGEEE